MSKEDIPDMDQEEIEKQIKNWGTPSEEEIIDKISDKLYHAAWYGANTIGVILILSTLLLLSTVLYPSIYNDSGKITVVLFTLLGIIYGSIGAYCILVYNL